jgi:hypothetical protein
MESDNMTEVVCYIMECIFNRKIRNKVGVCKRKTVSIGSMNSCIDALRIRNDEIQNAQLD